MVYCTVYKCPQLCDITLASDGEALVGLWLEGQKYFGAGYTDDMIRDDTLEAFSPVREWLDAYFASENPAVDGLLLRPAGSEFRQRVWAKLLEIPLGSLRTYGEIAAELQEETGKHCAPIAVGGAVGHNPISIVIPCHRVVGSNGSLTGYAGGVARKKWLLQHEGALRDGLFIPKKGTAL